MENVDVFVTSMFLDFKESNTTYNKRVQEIYDKKERFVFEMYNKTAVYIVPQNPLLEQKFEFEFEVFNAQEFLYGDKYTYISILLSGFGSITLIVGIVAYLGGF